MFVFVLCALAEASPLPAPQPATSDADYRRVVGLGAAVSAGIGRAYQPTGAAAAELWLFEAFMLGLGARYADNDREAGGSDPPDVAPVLTWSIRALSVHRRVSLDAVGRHSLNPLVPYDAYGASIEYRASGPHLARVTAVRDFGRNVTSLELGYTFRWEK